MTADAAVIDRYDDVDYLISASINALVAGSGLKREDVAKSVNISVSQFYRKLSGDGSSWKARDVAALADFFEVEIGTIYSGLDGLFRPAAQKREPLRAVHSGSRWRARRDSNSQPSDP